MFLVCFFVFGHFTVYPAQTRAAAAEKTLKQKQLHNVVPGTKVMETRHSTVVNKKCGRC